MMLRMKPEYIELTRQRKKTATTRLKDKGLGKVYELVSGSLFHPVKSGIRIKIFAVREWTLATITERDKEFLYQSEGFPNWNRFWDVLTEINKNKKIDSHTVFFSHWYDVIE